MLSNLDPASTLAIGLLIFSLLLVIAFEATNGIHDAANAVATVIYTKSLSPGQAVVWSGIMNFVGVLVGGISVAYALVELLPPEVLSPPSGAPAVSMLVSLFIAALFWNIGTWWFGLPNSSSHCLIGALIGVALGNALGPMFGHQDPAARQALKIGRAVEILVDVPAQVAIAIELADASADGADAVHLTDHGEAERGIVQIDLGQVDVLFVIGPPAFPGAAPLLALCRLSGIAAEGGRLLTGNADQQIFGPPGECKRCIFQHRDQNRDCLLVPRPH